MFAVTSGATQMLAEADDSDAPVGGGASVVTPEAPKDLVSVVDPYELRAVPFAQPSINAAVPNQTADPTLSPALPAGTALFSGDSSTVGRENPASTLAAASSGGVGGSTAAVSSGSKGKWFALAAIVAALIAVVYIAKRR